MKGGPRPGSGRPRRADPATAEEAARELRRYAPDVMHDHGYVVLTLPDAVALVNKLRRRKPAKETP